MTFYADAQISQISGEPKWLRLLRYCLGIYVYYTLMQQLFE